MYNEAYLQPQPPVHREAVVNQTPKDWKGAEGRTTAPSGKNPSLVGFVVHRLCKVLLYT